MILKKLSSAGVSLHVSLILAMLLVMLFFPFREAGLKLDGFDLLPVYNSLSSLIAPLGKFWTKLVGIVLIGTIGLLYNQLILKGDLLPKNGLFVALIYFVLMLAWDNLSFTWMSFALALLLLNSLLNISRLATEQHNYAYVMNATISVSMASLLVPQAVIFMLFIWLGFFTLRISSWREWTISFIGLLTPWFYYVVFLFLPMDWLKPILDIPVSFRNSD